MERVFESNDPNEDLVEMVSNPGGRVYISPKFIMDYNDKLTDKEYFRTVRAASKIDFQSRHNDSSIVGVDLKDLIGKYSIVLDVSTATFKKLLKKLIELNIVKVRKKKKSFNLIFNPELFRSSILSLDKGLSKIFSIRLDSTGRFPTEEEEEDMDILLADGFTYDEACARVYGVSTKM